MKNIILDYFKQLKTIEEKLFWIFAPLIPVLGISAIITTGFYTAVFAVVATFILFVLFPIGMIVVVKKTNNYKNAYPILCVITGALSIPLTFVLAGGFQSGMPLFCGASTCITALCISKKWRVYSMASCILGNCLAFYYVFRFGAPFPLISEGAVFKDIIISYFFSVIFTSFALFVATDEIRKYKANQDVLQQYFDTEVRKQLLEKAENAEKEQGSQRKKAAILFADICNFTSISEKMPPEQIS